VAPFDGVVVAGDLSQSIGAPVEQGKVLFEVAPLAGYRVVLHVDDRDIGYLAHGQRGELVLSSLPERKLPLVVSAITSVAAQVDGATSFASRPGSKGRRNACVPAWKASARSWSASAACCGYGRTACSIGCGWRCGTGCRSGAAMTDGAPCKAASGIASRR
jgi:hypothetical protein